MTMVAEKSDIDLYSESILLDPYSAYKELRDAGPAVYMEKAGMYAAARYRDVKEILATPEVFISGKGVMMNDDTNHAFAGGIGLCSDGEEHRRIRRVESRPLNPRQLRLLREAISSEARTIVEQLVDRGSFDAATDLAQYLPLNIVSNLVGLPEDGRERMLIWAAANFDSFGPPNERTRSAQGVFQEMYQYAMSIEKDKLRPDSWADLLQQSADAGEISEDEAKLMVLSYVAPSLDTTIFAISSAVWLFANNPDQWKKLRENPKLIPNAINEIVRIESPIQGFSRFCTEQCNIDGQVLPKDSRIIVLYGSANRDERHWGNPEEFDIERKNAGEHLGFGHGKHICIGNNLARLEISALFAELIERVESFEIVEMERLVNNTLRGIKKLDVKISRA